MEDAFLEKRMQRRWQMSALPLDLFERLPLGTLEAGIDVGYLQVLMEKSGVPRRVAENWPKVIGFPIVQLLAERQRVEFAVFSDRRAIMRATRKHAPPVTEPPVKVTGAELLQALYAAGCRPSKPRALQLS